MKVEDKLGADGDAVYEALMKAHDGLATEESHTLNARLVLMLVNEVGDPERLRTLFSQARKIGFPTSRD